jgi:hypothetical protein
MAEDKKGFLMYADQREQFDQLTDEQAGKLIKHLFSYVNDENPQTNDIVTKLSFTPIKSQLKRDLTKYRVKKEQWSAAGRASAEARKLKKEQASTNPTNVNDRSNRSTDSTVNVNDNDNVNVNVNDNVSVNVKVNDIKKEAPNAGVVFPFDSEKFKKQWNLWKDYKLKEFRFKYKTPQSEQAALIKLAELANKNEDQAILIINESFANGWKGFFKTQNNGTGQKGSNPTDDELANALREAGFGNG